MDDNKKSPWEMVMSSFTDDLWIEILLRLPFKSLIRCKSVSKSWFSIISSHRFAKSHLATAAKDDEVIIVQLRDSEDYDGSFSLLHLDTDCISKNLNYPYSQGEYPFEPIHSKLKGSDCGILCVAVNVSNWPAVEKDDDIYLWNPATRHSKLIPPYVLDDDDWTLGVLGFGFDHIDLDFKVVRVVSSTISDLIYSAEVYSSNRNNWRKIEPGPIDVPYSTHKFDLCFHGFLFVKGCHGGMMAFDLNKEVFLCDIDLPASPFDDYFRGVASFISDYKDSIAFVSYKVRDMINLYTLDDEACLRGGGVKASWTKMLSVDVGVPINYVEGLFNSVQFLLIDDEEFDWLVYNSDRKVATNLLWLPNLQFGEVFKYTESLFSLVGSKRVKWTASSLTLL